MSRDRVLGLTGHPTEPVVEVVPAGSRFRQKEASADPDLLAAYQVAFRAIFAHMGGGFYDSTQLISMLRELRALGVPEALLRDAIWHYEANRTPFLRSFMGD